MNIDSIVDAHELRKARVEEAYRIQKEQHDTAIALNRAKIDERFAQVVRPVFEDIARQLQAKGYPSTARVATDVGSSGSHASVDIELCLSSTKDERRYDYTIKVVGVIERMSVFLSFSGRNKFEMPPEVPLSSVTSEWIEDKAARFVSAAFND